MLLAMLACCNGKMPRPDAIDLVELTPVASHMMFCAYDAAQLFAAIVSGVKWWRGGLGSIWPRPTSGCTW